MSRENREQLASYIEDLVGENPLPPSAEGRNAALDAEIPETDTDFETLKRLFPDRYNMCLHALQEVARDIEGGELRPDLKEYIRKRLLILNNLDRYIERHKAGEESTLKDRQFNVFEDTRDFLEGRKGRVGKTEEVHEESTGKRGYIKLPTGVGKTVLFTELIEAMVGEEDHDSGVRTLIVVPRNLLIEQTQQKIGQFAANLDMGQINGIVQSVGKNGLIITYDSLRLRIKDGMLNPADFDVVVLDEAHRALGPKTQDVMDHEGFANAIMLGFTATPTFDDRRKVSNFLPYEIHNMEIREAVELELLCGFRTIVAKTSVDLTRVKVKADGNFNDAELTKAINTEARNQAVLQVYQQGFNGEKAIGYTHSVDHAIALAKLFNDNGIPAGFVCGAGKIQNKMEQEEALAKHRRGEIKVLFNAKLLVEGYDDTDLAVGFRVSPSGSIVEVEQSGGRILRYAPDKFATWVDFVDKTEANQNPILFAEVAGGTAVPPEAGFVSERERVKGKSRVKPVFSIDGVDVIVDSEDVAVFVARAVKDRNFAKKVKEIPEGWFSEMDLRNKWPMYIDRNDPLKSIRYPIENYFFSIKNYEYENDKTWKIKKDGVVWLRPDIVKAVNDYFENEEASHREGLENVARPGEMDVFKDFMVKLRYTDRSKFMELCSKAGAHFVDRYDPMLRIKFSYITPEEQSRVTEFIERLGGMPEDGWVACRNIVEDVAGEEIFRSINEKTRIELFNQIKTIVAEIGAETRMCFNIDTLSKTSFITKDIARRVFETLVLKRGYDYQYMLKAFEGKNNLETRIKNLEESMPDQVVAPKFGGPKKYSGSFFNALKVKIKASY